jgi:putative phosphoribosyl transferase
MDAVFFKNREEAGMLLAEKLDAFASEKAVILGIPRGGIPIAYCIAGRLKAPMDALVLRKLPIPFDPEAGFGAVTLDRLTVLNEELVGQLGLGKSQVNQIVEDVYKEVLRRNRIYRKNRRLPEMKGRTVIIADDGLASGYTMLAGIRLVKKLGAKKVVAAIPVAHDQAFALVQQEADHTIALYISSAPFFAVASFYEDFSNISDEQAVEYLEGRIKGSVCG